MNPKTYPTELRGRWYLQVEKYGKAVTEVCKIFGISRKTYYKWYAHDHQRSSAQYHARRRQPNLKLTHEVCRVVEAQKLRTNYGPLKMRLYLQRRLGLTVSTTILYRFYQRRHLIRRAQKKLPWYQPLAEHIIPQAPGDLVQVDTKYVWLGHRRQYQRTFLDVFTGLQHAVICPTLDAQATVVAFRDAVNTFTFPLRCVQTDNGAENRGTFHQYLIQCGVRHVFIPKSSPQWNGAVERAHGTMDQEFALNPIRPWKTLAAYLHYYNTERIHLGKYCQGRTPLETLQNFQANHPEVLPLSVN